MQQLPETPDLPSSAAELLLGLQPRLRLPALQGGRRPLCETALGLLHPRAVSALQPVAVTIRELSEPPPYAHDRGRLVSSLLQVDLPASCDRTLEILPSRPQFNRRPDDGERARGPRSFLARLCRLDIHRCVCINSYVNSRKTLLISVGTADVLS